MSGVISGLSATGLLKLLQREDGKLNRIDSQDCNVFAALRTITRNVSALDLEVWDSPEVRSRKPATGPGADRLRRLLRKPCPWLQGRDLRTLMTWNQVLDGEVTLVLRGIDFAPVASEREQPEFLTPHSMAEVEYGFVDGKRMPEWTISTRIDGRERRDPVPDHAVIQVKDPDPQNALRGMGVRGPLRITTGITWAASTYLHAFFRNGAEPGLIFENEFGLAPKGRADFIREWEQRHGGNLQANRPAILPAGMRAKTLVASHREQDILALLKHTRLDTLMVLGVPESEVGLIKDATYSNGISANAGFWIQTLLPIVFEIEEGLNDPSTGLATRFGSRLYIGHDMRPVRQVLQAITGKAEALSKLVNSGVPRDHAVELLGIDVAPVEGGEVPLIQNNLSPLTMVASGEVLAASRAPAAAEPPRAAPRARSAPGTKRSRARDVELVDTVLRSAERRTARILRRMVTEMRHRQLELLDAFDPRTAGGAARSIGPGELDAALLRSSEFEAPLVDAMTEEFEVMLDDAADLVASELGRSLAVYDLQHPQVVDYLKVLQTRVRHIPGTIQDALREALAEGIAANESITDLKQRVRATMNVEGKRTERIAQVTSGEAVSGGRYVTMQLEGVTRHEWSTANDEKVRESHAAQEGVIVRVGELFPNGLRFPLDPRGPAHEVVACRCVALAIE